MSDYITTYGGTHFIPTKPDIDAIHISDIAHSLSLICRGNGHVKTFFSVGQHCIHCALEAEAREYKPHVVLACLLHDAAEAYLSDVPRPFKQYLTDYETYENRILNLIYKKYLKTLPAKEEQTLIKSIDDDMLYYDLKFLLNEKSERPEPVMKTLFSYEFIPFETIEQQYLSLFYKYYK